MTADERMLRNADSSKGLSSGRAGTTSEEITRRLAATSATAYAFATVKISKHALVGSQPTSDLFRKIVWINEET